MLRRPDPYLQALLDIGRMVGYWPLDERAGPRAFDRIGGRHGTYNGGVLLGQAAHTADGAGSVKLDGTSGYMELADDDAFSPVTTTRLSVGVWATITDSEDRVIVAKASAANTYEWEVHQWATRFAYFYGRQSGGAECSLVASATLAPGDHFLGFTLDTAGQSEAAYVDGALIGTDTTWVGALSNTAGQVTVGCRNDNGRVAYFDGRCSKLFIARKVLAAAEWRYLWAIGRGA